MGGDRSGRALVRVTHRHVTLPAQVMPVEGDGGVVKLRVIGKVPVQQRHSTRAALESRAPNLRTFQAASEDPHVFQSKKGHNQCQSHMKGCIGVRALCATQTTKGRPGSGTCERLLAF